MNEARKARHYVKKLFEHIDAIRSESEESIEILKEIAELISKESERILKDIEKLTDKGDVSEDNIKAIQEDLKTEIHSLEEVSKFKGPDQLENLAKIAKQHAEELTEIEKAISKQARKDLINRLKRAISLYKKDVVSEANIEMKNFEQVEKELAV